MSGVCDGATKQCISGCGNGTLEGVEECDDGNLDNTGLCSATCKVCDPALSALTKTGAALGDAGPNAAWALGAEAAVEFWVRFAATATAANADMAVSTAYDDSSTGGWYCFATPAGVSFALRYADGNATLDHVGSISADRWHHIACDYDGTSMRIFVDGGLVSSRAASGSTAAHTGHLLLLHRNQFYTGLTGQFAVREIRVGNKSRYTSSFTPSWKLAPTAGTVGLWHADEGTGTTLANMVTAMPAISLSGSTAWRAYGGACQ